MNRTVVLNGDYTFLNTVGWKRAVRLVLSGKSEVVKYDETRSITSAGGSVMNVPLVIRLIKVIRMIYKNKVPFTRKNVLIRDNDTCQYCDSKKEMTIDHVIPSSRGGKNSFENCVAACRKCNNKKGRRTPYEAQMFLKRQPCTPTISEFCRIKMKKVGLDRFLKEIGVY